MLQGRLHAARELYAIAESYVDERDERDARVACPLEVGLGDLFYEWNDLESAEHHIRRGIELSELHGTTSSLTSAYLTLMRIQQARGNVSAAQETFHQAEETVQHYNLVKGIANQVALWRVRRWLAAGDLAAASQWGERLSGDAPGPLSLTADLSLTLARLRIARREFIQAVELLERLKNDAKTAGQFSHVIQASILTAIARNAAGSKGQAVQDLGEALALAEPEGYLRTFVDEGQTVKILIDEFILCEKLWRENPTLRSYAARISAAFRALEIHEPYQAPGAKPDQTGGQPSEQPGLSAFELIEPLSEREMEVLRLICAGYSNQKIAERLFVSIYTIKKHNTHIFAKLNVSSRTQAIIRARQLGLV